LTGEQWNSQAPKYKSAQPESLSSYPADGSFCLIVNCLAHQGKIETSQETSLAWSNSDI